jgi:hypothetical protein
VNINAGQFEPLPGSNKTRLQRRWWTLWAVECTYWDAGAPATAHGQIPQWQRAELGYYPTKPGRPLKKLIANIRAALQHVKNTAEQFKSIDPWTVFLRYVSNKSHPCLPRLHRQIASQPPDNCWF